jgi:hypothetical protein
MLFCLKKIGYFSSILTLFFLFFLQTLIVIKCIIVSFNRFRNFDDCGSVASLALTGQLDKSNQRNDYNIPPKKYKSRPQ